MKTDRARWEARYRSGDIPHDVPPSPLLRRWLPALPRGLALDVATGLGRHAILLAKAGFRVDAVDISPTGLAEAARRARRAGVRVRWIEADLDTYTLPRGRYDVVVNTFFLKRSLFSALRAALRPGGVMLFETHLAGGEPDGPKGAAHRLRHGELRRQLEGWEILEHEEGALWEDGRSRLLGRIVARRPVTRPPRRR